MSDRGLAVVGFKLLGLWLLAYAAIEAAGIPYVWHTGPVEVRNWALVLLLRPLVSLGVGIPVWFSADSFANRVFPSADGEPAGQQVGSHAAPLFALGASLVGLWLVAEGVPSLASSLYIFVHGLRRGVLGVDETRRGLLWSTSAKAAAVAGVVRVVIGIALLAGPARLAAVVARIQKEFAGSLMEEEQSKQR